MRSSFIFTAITLSVAAASASNPESSATALTSEDEIEKRGLLDPIVCLLGGCINTATDPLNCGAVGKKCATSYPNAPVGAQCVNSVCMPKSCNLGYGLNTATASCIPITNDVNNCGSVGNVCSLANALTQTCVSGTCVAQTCATGYSVSLGTCTKVYNLQTDTNNCGVIGRVCPSSYSNGVGSTCVAGICQPTACNSGYVFNALTGSCQNVLSDLSNCGSLGNVCSFANGVGSCTNGVCTLNSCSTGFYKVNGVCTYLNLQSDGNNCGTVGNICAFANGAGSCQAGKCTFSSCASGYKLVSNACQKIDLNSDPSNCGTLGLACAASYLNGGSGVCVNGKCSTTCNSGYLFDSTLGFCRSVSNDASNCGAIGRVCTATNGIASCVNGICGISSCSSGFKLVSGTCQAIDLTSDINNCGALGTVCPATYANGGTGFCSGGKCMTVCSAGYAFDSASNYCRPINNDISNCGSVGFVCNVANALTQTCSSGVCQATSCASGFNLVSGTCLAVNTLTDVNNCGKVGYKCTFTPAGAAGVCLAGKCVATTCPTGYYVNAGICTLMPSARARLAKKDKIPKKRTLCPTGETACPIIGSSSFSRAVSQHFASLDEGFDSVGGFECIDTNVALDSCGGCASTGQGVDCNSIPHVAGVGCDSGACIVMSCLPGYRPSLDSSKCVRAGSSHKNTTEAARRHLKARQQRSAAIAHQYS